MRLNPFPMKSDATYDSPYGCALYVHFPFCRSRCLYCAFYSTVGPAVRHIDYLNALMAELRRNKNWIAVHAPVRTIYFGGGTPSLIDARLMREFCTLLIKELGNDLRLEEFTIEANPEDIRPEALREWLKAGVTRISLGVQSMHPDELRAVGRRHSPRDVAGAVKLISTNADVSIDLICGLPLQSEGSFSESLDAVLELEPDHISVYMLELEDGSALHKLVSSGKVAVPSDGDVATMYVNACRKMDNAGLEQYEISNFALPGHHSRHNSSYWDGTPYLGLGPSAASFPAHDRRRVNSASLKQYMQGGAAAILTEELSPLQQQEEYILTRLRTIKGICLADFSVKFGNSAADALCMRAGSDIKNGLLAFSGGWLRLNGPEACLVSDAVMVRLMPG